MQLSSWSLATTLGSTPRLIRTKNGREPLHAEKKKRSGVGKTVRSVTTIYDTS